MKFFYVNVLKISFLKFTFMDIYFSIKGVPSLNILDDKFASQNFINIARLVQKFTNDIITWRQHQLNDEILGGRHRFRLRLLSCGRGLESHANHLSFFKQARWWNNVSSESVGSPMKYSILNQLKVNKWPSLPCS